MPAGHLHRRLLGSQSGPPWPPECVGGTLSAHWRLDEASPTWATTKGGANPPPEQVGTYTNQGHTGGTAPFSVTQGDTGMTAPYGTASFKMTEGVGAGNASLDLFDFGAFDDTACTLIFWCQFNSGIFNSTATGVSRRIARFGNQDLGGGWRTDFYVDTNASGLTARFRCVDDGAAVGIGAYDIVADTPYMLAYTANYNSGADETTSTFYINGVQEDTPTVTSGKGIAGPLMKRDTGGEAGFALPAAYEDAVVSFNLAGVVHILGCEISGSTLLSLYASYKDK